MNESPPYCDVCPEPSKRAIGFYDQQGPGGELVGGPMFACDNEACPITAERIIKARQVRERQRKSRQQNAENCVSPATFRNVRICKGETMRSAAKALGVQPHVICDWEQEREPLPPGMFWAYILNLAGAAVRWRGAVYTVRSINHDHPVTLTIEREKETAFFVPADELEAAER